MLFKILKDFNIFIVVYFAFPNGQHLENLNGLVLFINS